MLVLGCAGLPAVDVDAAAAPMLRGVAAGAAGGLVLRLVALDTDAWLRCEARDVAEPSGRNAGLLPAAAVAAVEVAAALGVVAVDGARLPAAALCMDMALAGLLRDEVVRMDRVPASGLLFFGRAVPTSSTSRVAVVPHLNWILSRTLPASRGSHSMRMAALLLGDKHHSKVAVAVF